MPFHRAHRGAGRPLPQPGFELGDGGRLAAGEHLDAAVIQIDGMTGNSKTARHVRRARAEKHTLNTTGNPQ